MCLVTDKQDCTFVEKVHLPESEIISLCNKLVPFSASAAAYSDNPSQIRINFNALKERCLRAVGLYGDKKMMICMLRNQGLLGDLVLSEMEAGEFEPGLYVIVPANSAAAAVVFYWHQGQNFIKASRNDVSCNLIRYLVELCDFVYICVEGSHAFDAMVVSTTIKASQRNAQREYEEYCKLRDALNVYDLMSEEERMADGKEKLLKETEDAFVRKSKDLLLGYRKDRLGTLYVEEVGFKSHSLLQTIGTPWKKSCGEQLELKYSIVQECRSIAWKACELRPLRKNINELNNNSGPAIIPACGELIDLEVIIPELASLLKVVLLKSGELLIFIHSTTNSCLQLFFGPRIGSNLNMVKPIYTFRRHFDLFCLDEATQSLALYGKDEKNIGLFKFDESFKHIYWTGIEVSLEAYKGSNIIIWMHFIPGKMELLLVDETNRVRILEIHEKPVMRVKCISLQWPQPLTKACITVDGHFFIAMRKFKSSIDVAIQNLESSGIKLDIEIYVLGNTMFLLKTISLNTDLRTNNIDLEQLKARITKFGSQSHLVLYNPAHDPTSLCSYLLKTTLATEGVELLAVKTKTERRAKEETEFDGSCACLEYVYHSFEKFGTIPALFPQDERSITFKVVLQSRTDPANGVACIRYLEALL
ncbi:hypothetical protein SUGI_0672530 [Cryptomeria japonica]|nr:hypothetical protein SUGI_0672530 [Cryptomeria japonica]